jgi:hypothetical protein
MNTRLILCLYLSFVFSAGAKTVEPKSKIIAAIKIESKSESSQYKILTSPNKLEKSQIIRTSSQLKNKTLQVPQGLAKDLKAELLSISWKTRYKSQRAAGVSCLAIATISIESEDDAQICADQTEDLSHIFRIKKSLDDLMREQK